jgi:hypothetical protein
MYKRKTRRQNKNKNKKVSKKLQVIGSSVYVAELGGKRNRRK